MPLLCQCFGKLRFNRSNIECEYVWLEEARSDSVVFVLEWERKGRRSGKREKQRYTKKGGEAQQSLDFDCHSLLNNLLFVEHSNSVQNKSVGKQG